MHAHARPINSCRALNSVAEVVLLAAVFACLMVNACEVAAKTAEAPRAR